MKLTILLAISLCFSGCVFNFDIEGQKTELEKQVIGEYPKPNSKELVRSVLKGGLSLRKISRISPEDAIAIHKSYLDSYISEKILHQDESGLLSVSPSKKSYISKLGDQERTNLLVSLAEYNSAKLAINKSM